MLDVHLTHCWYLLDVTGIAIVGKDEVMMTGRLAENNVGSFSRMGLKATSPYKELCSRGSHIALTTEDNSLFVFNPENGAVITYLRSQK